jgi:methyl-accepting chemotaxis protein
MDIAASSREQSTALHEVNTAINQMDQVTQQNAAMVEESTAAAHTLSQETEELRRLIGMFRVAEHGMEGSARRQMSAKPGSRRAAA